MNTRRQLPPTTSASSTSTSGSLGARRRSISACSDVIDLLLYAKKAGLRPLSVRLPASAHRHESSGSSIASGQRRTASIETRSPTAAGSGGMRVTACAIPVDPVVLALGTQRASQRQRLTGLAVASEQLHRAAKAEQRVVVGRGPGGHSVELRRGAFVAARMEQRPSERLADRGLLRLQVPRFAERHDRRLIVAVAKQLAATLVEVIHALHTSILTACTRTFGGHRPVRRRSTTSRIASATTAL